jgi:hypothetical protein
MDQVPVNDSLRQVARRFDPFGPGRDRRRGAIAALNAAATRYRLPDDEPSA